MLSCAPRSSCCRRGSWLRSGAFATLVFTLAVVACGARTGLDVGASPASAEPVDSQRISPGPCPACPDTEPCTGHHACVLARDPDKCTYGWCCPHDCVVVPGATPPIWVVNSVLCQEKVPAGWCASGVSTIVCENPGPSFPDTDDGGPMVPTHCVWPPPDTGDICQPTDFQGDQLCGAIRCGPGCQCLCDNFCWCGP